MPETIKASEQNVVRIFSNDYLFPTANIDRMLCEIEEGRFVR